MAWWVFAALSVIWGIEAQLGISLPVWLGGSEHSSDKSALALLALGIAMCLKRQGRKE